MNDNERLTAESTHKRPAYGIDKYEIQPRKGIDFQIGTYKVSVSLKSNCELEQARRSMLLRVAPISAIVAIDGLDVPYETTISDQPHFFTYSIAHIEDFERHLLLLNVSNRSKL